MLPRLHAQLHRQSLSVVTCTGWQVRETYARTRCTIVLRWVTGIRQLAVRLNIKLFSSVQNFPSGVHRSANPVFQLRPVSSKISLINLSFPGWQNRVLFYCEYSKATMSLILNQLSRSNGDAIVGLIARLVVQLIKSKNESLGVLLFSPIIMDWWMLSTTQPWEQKSTVNSFLICNEFPPFRINNPVSFATCSLCFLTYHYCTVNAKLKLSRYHTAVLNINCCAVINVAV